MNRTANRDEREEIARLARPLHAIEDLDPLLDRVGDAAVVLLGEASHGTAEYYAWRAALTERLIAERGFSFVAVEGDWPDCYRVNRWVKDRGDRDRTAREMLGDFARWPTWMWANEEVADFAHRLREHNRATGSAVGFYGLDVYSLWDSLDRLLRYLDDADVDADTAAAAGAAERCFAPYGRDPHEYARATRLVPSDCEDEVVGLLAGLRRAPLGVDGDPEADFDARQNAEVVAGAEHYYRTMVRGDHRSWNVRDLHMVDTLDRLLAHHGDGARAVVWEHNTHVGDARATDMTRAGMLNVGQVVRERRGEQDCVLVGFGGYRGSVIAASAWGGNMERMPVPPALGSTHEALLHAVTPRPSLLVFPDRRDSPWLSARRGHRAIGVVYHPELDPYGNWVPTEMGRRYDAFCFFDETTALHPLHGEAIQPRLEHETEPWGT